MSYYCYYNVLNYSKLPCKHFFLTFIFMSFRCAGVHWDTVAMIICHSQQSRPPAAVRDQSKVDKRAELVWWLTGETSAQILSPAPSLQFSNGHIEAQTHLCCNRFISQSCRLNFIHRFSFLQLFVCICLCDAWCAPPAPSRSPGAATDQLHLPLPPVHTQRLPLFLLPVRRQTRAGTVARSRTRVRWPLRDPVSAPPLPVWSGRGTVVWWLSDGSGRAGVRGESVFTARTGDRGHSGVGEVPLPDGNLSWKRRHAHINGRTAGPLCAYCLRKHPEVCEHGRLEQGVTGQILYWVWSGNDRLL